MKLNLKPKLGVCLVYCDDRDLLLISADERNWDTLFMTQVAEQIEEETEYSQYLMIPNKTSITARVRMVFFPKEQSSRFGHLYLSLPLSVTRASLFKTHRATLGASKSKCKN